MAVRPTTATGNPETRAHDRDEPVSHIFGVPQVHTAPHKGNAAKTKITCGRCGWSALYFIKAKMGAGGSLNIENNTWVVVNTLDSNTSCAQCGIYFNRLMAQKQLAELAAKEAAEPGSGTSPSPQIQNAASPVAAAPTAPLSSASAAFWQKQPEKKNVNVYSSALNQQAIQNHTTALQTAAEIPAK